MNRYFVAVFMMLGVVIGVGGCQAVEAASVPATEIPASTQTPTLTSTSSATATHTPRPTWTALPTLAPAEAQERISELYRTNGGCDLPCWWGITPGETTWEDARARLLPFAHITEFEYGEWYQYTVEPMYYDSYYAQEYWVQDGIVEIVIIPTINAPSEILSGPIMYDLSEFLTAYGLPDEVGIWPEPFNGLWSTHFETTLFYLDLGVMMHYAQTDDGGIYYEDSAAQNCYEQIDRARELFLWMPGPDTEMMFDYIQQGHRIPPHWSAAFRPLESATGMDIEAFYQTFKDPNHSVCLVVPIDAPLWMLTQEPCCPANPTPMTTPTGY